MPERFKLNGKVVLLIEPDPLVCLLAKDSIEATGAAVETLPGLAAALAAANGLSHIDAIVASIALSEGLTVLQFTTALRSAFGQTPILMTDSDISCSSPLLPSAVTFLSKPWAPAALAKALYEIAAGGAVADFSLFSPDERKPLSSGLMAHSPR
ncbi:response regulator [Pseudomonas typographi]|uniref:Response regulator n=1 Tax=Pseudomonas typographi TaxID=2715964 RepID=A0ABR7ZAJ0_9PSED|nr:response regulator [Pseudomonas typographi]MBD1554153.1 response regulator [Pseudomonas typographi]MBD1590254.1 response regulator [Pseudomonas typographi]MBD1602377.1 response regulator [Pseudomonas typographi]